MFDFATSSALLTTLVTSLLTKASTDLYNSSTDKSQETIKKILNNLKLNNKIQAYYKATTGSLNPIKTFMFRENGVPFYQIYYPISIWRNNPNTNSKEILNVDKDIKNIFTNNKCITVIGSAGSGKTMLVKHLFLSAVEEAKLIPIMIEFRKIDNSVTIYEYVKNKLLKLLTVDDNLLDSILKSGKFLFILDGLDEISGTILEKRISEIESITERYTTNFFVLTSRYDVGAEVLPRFSTYRICNLREEDLSPFIDQQCRFIIEGYTLAKKIKDSIRKQGVTNAYSDYFKNPLLLSMFILVFNDNPVLPANKREFYENVFHTLWSKHDSLKGGGYSHDKNYGKDTYFKILKRFCYNSYKEDKWQFKDSYLNTEIQKVIEKEKLNCETDKVIKDLVSNISILFKDGDEYTFPHRSMQEYFTAQYIYGHSVKFKEKYYSDKLNSISSYDDFRSHWIESGNFRHENLFSLLFVIDKYCYSLYFLLPLYNIFKQKLEVNGNSKKEICSTFYLLTCYAIWGIYVTPIYTKEFSSISFLHYFDRIVSLNFGNNSAIENTLFEWREMLLQIEQMNLPKSFIKQGHSYEKSLQDYMSFMQTKKNNNPIMEQLYSLRDRIMILGLKVYNIVTVTIDEIEKYIIEDDNDD